MQEKDERSVHPEGNEMPQPQEEAGEEAAVVPLCLPASFEEDGDIIQLESDSEESSTIVDRACLLDECSEHPTASSRRRAGNLRGICGEPGGKYSATLNLLYKVRYSPAKVVLWGASPSICC